MPDGPGHNPPQGPAINHAIAARLHEMGELLQLQRANPHRVRAYRNAAATVAALSDDVREIYRRDGLSGLERLPTIGQSIARAVAQMIDTGRWAHLERLRGDISVEERFQVLPGIGPELARRVHDHLHVDTLEALEAAAWDGRLEQVPGFGRRRVEMLRSELAQALAGVRTRPRQPDRDGVRPGVELLLDVDAEYRHRAAAGELPKIAPRRFNPDGEAWLPVIHTQRGPWHFTALFSNTARAHTLGHTRDWVVLFYELGDHPEGQATVVTEHRGELIGRRVVRGREVECRAWYRHLAPS